MQKIKELIKPQLDDLFVDIQKLVKKSQERQPSSPEVLTQDMHKNLISRSPKNGMTLKIVLIV